MPPHPPGRRFGALLLATALAGACAHGRGTAKQSPLLGRPLELTLPDLAGREVDVAAERGRVRVVDFWATWCTPCREALPALDRLFAELGPRGLSVVGVSYDEEASPIPEFLREVPVRFPILHDRGGERSSAPLGVARLPTTLLVDRRGLVRFVHEGWTAGQAEEERREVELLLAEP